MFWLHSLSYTLIALIYFILISRIARTYFLYGISLHHSGVEVGSIQVNFLFLSSTNSINFVDFTHGIRNCIKEIYCVCARARGCVRAWVCVCVRARVCEICICSWVGTSLYIGSMSCRSPAMLLPPDFQQLDFYDTWYPAQHHTILQQKVQWCTWESIQQMVIKCYMLLTHSW